MNARSKYYGEQDPRHGGTLHWNTAHLYGVPFRGDNPPTTLKPHEIEQLQPIGESHVAFFSLAIDEQLGYYEWIRDRAANGLFRIEFIQRFINPSTAQVSVYVEWTQYYVIHPATGGRSSGPPSMPAVPFSG